MFSQQFSEQAAIKLKQNNNHDIDHKVYNTGDDDKMPAEAILTVL